MRALPPPVHNGRFRYTSIRYPGRQSRRPSRHSKDNNNLLIIPLTYSINGIMSMKLKFLYREKSLYIVLIAGFFLS